MNLLIASIKASAEAATISVFAENSCSMSFPVVGHSHMYFPYIVAAFGDSLYKKFFNYHFSDE